MQLVAARFDPRGPGVQLRANPFLVGAVAVDLQTRTVGRDEVRLIPAVRVGLEGAGCPQPGQQGRRVGLHGAAEDTMPADHPFLDYYGLRLPYLPTSGSETCLGSICTTSSLFLPSAG